MQRQLEKSESFIHPPAVEYSPGVLQARSLYCSFVAVDAGASTGSSYRSVEEASTDEGGGGGGPVTVAQGRDDGDHPLHG